MTAGVHSSAALLAANDKLIRDATYKLLLVGSDLAGNIADTALVDGVTYEPALVHLALVPARTGDTITLSTDSTLRFSAGIKDADSNKVNSTVVWSVLGAAGALDASGIFTPSQVGVCRVIGTVGALSDTSNVIRVIPAGAVSISLPSRAVSVEVDDSLTLTASGLDSRGNPVSIDPSQLSFKLIGSDSAASLSAGGVVQGMGLGKASVEVTYQNNIRILHDTALVTVTGWVRAVAPRGNDVLTFGRRMRINVPSIPGFAADTVRAIPYGGPVKPSGIALVGSGVFFDAASVADFGAPVTITLRLDSAALRQAGVNGDHVRMYHRSRSDSSQWFMDWAAVGSAGWFSAPAESLAAYYYLGVDSVVPALQNTTASTVVGEGAPVNLSFSASDNIANAHFVLRYRVGGERDWHTDTLARDMSGKVNFLVPEAAASRQGIVYAADESDGPNTGSVAASGVIVNVPLCAMPDSFAANAYHMLSVPANNGGKRISEVLYDDIGGFDKTKWRMYDLAGETFTEILADNATALIPGHAVWLRTKQPPLVDLDNGTTVPVVDPYRLVLTPGWNAIATPFRFAVLWPDILAASGASADSVMGLYAYNYRDKSWSDPSATTRLEPWQGYLVRNMTKANMTLLVPAFAADTKLLKTSADAAGVSRIAITVSGAPDLAPAHLVAAFGYADGADGFDRHDFMAPPDLDTRMPASFNKSAWGNASGRYFIDSRGLLRQGAAWTFTVGSIAAEQVITARLGLSGSLPKGFELCLIDDSRGLYGQVDSTFSWLQKKGQSRSFTLLAGTSQFIGEATRSLHRLPGAFSLYHNFPNPLRSITTIRYAIPLLDNGKTVWTPVRLSVYDLKGRMLAELVNDRQEPGFYTIKWDGSNRSGQRLGAGAYMLRITMGTRFEAVQRMQVVR